MRVYKIIMKELRNAMLFALLTLLAMLQPAFAMLDPSAVYCEKLGYNFTVITTEEGEQGICQLPDGPHDAWDFLKGKTGIEYSYCKIHGYEIKTVSDEKKCASIASLECAVCVLENGTEIEVTKLMGLSFEEEICGNGICGPTENYLNCPEDCAPPAARAKPKFPFYLLIIFAFIVIVLFFLIKGVKVQKI